MPSFILEATARTPQVTLDPEAGTLLLLGESYPEDVPSFYAEIHDELEAFFTNTDSALHIDIKLTYFNSSSARALMELLDMLDEKAGNGKNIAVTWHCDPDDDITREFAQDISSDTIHITVEIVELLPEDNS